LPKELVMTKEEASTLVFHAPSTIRLQFRPIDEKFVAMKAGPCPLFLFHTCYVYEHRPFNCRRFGCMRPDTKAEPFEVSGANMRDRTETNRKARRLAIQMQRKAQKWALSHGWKDDAPAGE
jgi:Fe-S-cluster containining protein